MLSVIQSVAKNLLSLCMQGEEILRYATNDEMKKWNADYAD